MCSLRGAVHVERLVKPHVLLSQSRYAFSTSCVPIIFYCPVTEHSYSLATLLVWPLFCVSQVTSQDTGSESFSALQHKG